MKSGNHEEGRTRSPATRANLRLLGVVAVLALGNAAIPASTLQAADSQPNSGAASVAARSHTVPAGTILYLQLATPVSTTFSNLDQPITATVARQVEDGGAVVIPLGAKVEGEIARLIPSSNPSERAKMILKFTQLDLPGQPPMLLDGHVTQIENARETVSAQGEIVGVLASEVPATMINGALGKLGKSGTQSASPSPGWFGHTDTTINYPSGTDLDFTFDQPLTLPVVFPPAFALELPAGDEAAILPLLARSPQRVSSKTGTAGDPINLVFIGSGQEIQDAFQKAGWTPASRMSENSLWDAVQAVIKGRGYGAAPVSDLYLFGRPEDLAFEKMLNTMAKRHHIRLWRSGAQTPDGRDIWLAASTHDNGIDIHPGVISHAIDPDLDLERAKVAADLAGTGRVAAEQLVTPSNPLSQGLTATGGTWKTDGRLMVIGLKD